MKDVLCNKAFPLGQRLKLLGATVSQTALYGAGTWTLKEDRMRKLRSAQRTMLRMMVTHQRRKKAPRIEESQQRKRSWEQEEEEEEEAEEDETQSGLGEPDQEEEAAESEDLEPWHEWVQRATRIAIRELEKAQVSDWAEAARQSIWTLAGHMSRRDDKRWSTLILDWQPRAATREVGRPLMRWSDALEAFTAKRFEEQQPGLWRMLAEDRAEWKALATEFRCATARRA